MRIPRRPLTLSRHAVPAPAILVALAALLGSGCGTDAFDEAPDPEFELGDARPDSTSSTDVEEPDSTPDSAGRDIGLTDTSADDVTEQDTAPAEDVQNTCIPGRSWCAENAVVTCNPDGTGSSRVLCEDDLCLSDIDGARCVPPEDFPTECPIPGARHIGPGSFTLDLCSSGDDALPIDQNDCATDGTRSGGDAVLTFTLTETRDVSIDLRDDDDRAAVDTIVYVRRACDDAESQIACSDDVACEDSDVTTGCDAGIQVRQSKLELRLEPGDYTVVADFLEYRGFGCGQVLLQLDF